MESSDDRWTDRRRHHHHHHDQHCRNRRYCTTNRNMLRNNDRVNILYIFYWMVIWTILTTPNFNIYICDNNDNTYENGGMFCSRTTSTFCFASELVEESSIQSKTGTDDGSAVLDIIATGSGTRALQSEEVPSSATTTSVKNPPLPSFTLRKSTTSHSTRKQKEQQQKHFDKLTLNQILYRAGKRGLGGGIPGAIAGGIQVLSLMWLRTIINYQCRYGTTFIQALRTLLNEGGIARLYCGVTFALIQAPISRFVSTAANDGVESLLSNLSLTKDWGPGRTTVVASIVVGFWRMLLMPIDTAKTVLQIDSVEGFRSLMRRVKAGRIGLLYSGAIANAISAVLGHYPWFYTYNVLQSSPFVQSMIPSQLLRNAGIGVVSSVVSDTFVNVFRVVKTTKQSLGSKQNASYIETIRIILAADGYKGLFGRGLTTRIYANAFQSLVFTLVWRGLSDYWRKRTNDEGDTQ